MCGKDSGLVSAIIENVKINVCRECAKFGKVLNRVVEPVAEKIKRKKERKEEQETVEIIVPDYAKKIRKARERLKMEQEEFAKKISLKESIVHKIETGHYKPSMDIARKLEKMLNIKLIMEYSEEKREYRPDESSAFTIGDLIKKK
jgi:putative transcription factor